MNFFTRIGTRLDNASDKVRTTVKSWVHNEPQVEVSDQLRLMEQLLIDLNRRLEEAEKRQK
jgi:hypothetical protein